MLRGLLRFLLRPFYSVPVAADVDMRFKTDMPYSPPMFYPIYASHGFNGTIQALVDVIKASATTTTFDSDLERTFVTNVSHWRSPTKEHELVTITYQVGDSGEHTTRHLGLERFKLQTNRTGSAMPASLETLSNSFNSSSSLIALDSAVISDELRGKEDDKQPTAIMSSEYGLVRSFDIQIGALAILKAISLAAALADGCGPYSYLEHMCWFWAASYMLLVQLELDYSGKPVTGSTGPLWGEAGRSKAYNIQLVDPTTGRLLVESFSATNERLKNLLRHIYQNRGDDALVQAQQDADKYRNLAPQVVDIQKVGTEGNRQLLSDIIAACEALREKKRKDEDAIRREGENKVAEERQKRDILLREQQEEFDRRNAVTQEALQREVEARAMEKREAMAREEEMKEELRKLREQLRAQSTTSPAAV